MKKTAMMSVLFVICFVMCFGVFSGDAAWAEGKKASDAAVKGKSYDDYVKDLKAGNTDIDYQAFRIAYTKTGKYNPYDKAAKEMITMVFDLTDYGLVLETVNTILEDDYTRMDAHLVAARTYKKKGDEDKAQFHLRIAKGLAGSITSSGDGLSADTAIIVISEDEENFWLGMSGFTPQKQQLVKKNGHTFDLLTVTVEKTAEKKDFYFNVDLPVEYKKRMQAKKPKK